MDDARRKLVGTLPRTSATAYSVFAGRAGGEHAGERRSSGARTPPSCTAGVIALLSRLALPALLERCRKYSKRDT